MSVNEKLDEAKFFLEMFHTLEKRESLTYDFKIQEEASFLLSAILNSFYSVTEIAKDDGIRRTDVDNFKNSHPLFYSGSGKGGLRNTTVHVKHISPDHSGYIPPKGDAVNFSLKKRPKIVKEMETDQNKLHFKMRPYFYLDVNGKFNRIMEL